MLVDDEETNGAKNTDGGEIGWVYLIHFDEPYFHARHYVGWTSDIEERMERHRTGRGSPLLKAVTDAGIKWYVVRVWRGTRALERIIKNRKKSRVFCYKCIAEREE